MEVTKINNRGNYYYYLPENGGVISITLRNISPPFKAGTMLIIIVNILVNVTGLRITMETHL